MFKFKKKASKERHGKITYSSGITLANMNPRMVLLAIQDHKTGEGEMVGCEIYTTLRELHEMFGEDLNDVEIYWEVDEHKIIKRVTSAEDGRYHIQPTQKPERLL